MDSPFFPDSAAVGAITVSFAGIVTREGTKSTVQVEKKR
jgi:hypothetical protein